LCAEPRLPAEAMYEVFGGAEGAIVFARRCRGEPSYFWFESFELLIEAAIAASPQARDVITYLVWLDGRYCLIFYPWDGEAAPATLGEFGEAVEAPPNYARHAMEHGRVIMGPAALREMAQVFEKTP